MLTENQQQLSTENVRLFHHTTISTNGPFSQSRSHVYTVLIKHTNVKMILIIDINTSLIM